MTRWELFKRGFIDWLPWPSSSLLNDDAMYAYGGTAAIFLTALAIATTVVLTVAMLCS